MRGGTEHFAQLLVGRLEDRRHRPIDVPGGERLAAREQRLELRGVELLCSRRRLDPLAPSKALEESHAKVLPKGGEIGLRGALPGREPAISLCAKLASISSLTW